MTIDSRALLAASNNAVWCDTVCRSHGAMGTFSDQVWVSPDHDIRFYPSLVTIADPGDHTRQQAAIRELAAAKGGNGWGVKDSFRALDLEPLGFTVAFDAQWIYRSADAPVPPADHDRIRWTIIHTAAELTDWETAWDGNLDGLPTDYKRVFLPTLLHDPAIAFIAAYHDQRIVAGAIANRTGDVVGISNIFTPPQASQAFVAGCIAGVMAAFPEVPIVGYEQGQDLDTMLAFGFETIGPLRIWLKAYIP